MQRDLDRLRESNWYNWFHNPRQSLTHLPTGNADAQAKQDLLNLRDTRTIKHNINIRVY